MAENSKIEWTDHTFNPWIGCTRLSPACDHCYAAVSTPARVRGMDWSAKEPRQRTADSTWNQPLKWDRQAAKDGVRRKVFCASLADVFDSHNSIDFRWRCELWSLINLTPNLDWLLLTKRPQNIKHYLPDNWGNGWPNVWLGTTVENQEEAERRIPHLLGISAKVHFLSCEPLLSEVDITKWLWHCHHPRNVDFPRNSIDWVITGGESGPKARPMHPHWACSLRDQCTNAGVSFFFKQWGEFAPYDACENTFGTNNDLQSGILTIPKRANWPDGEASYRVGKKRAGRMLDGVVHDAMPEGA